MSKHTPGPWKFGHWGDDFWVGADGYDGRKVARVTWGMGEEVEEGRENARLIAAAPDLLEALREAVEFFDSEYWLTSAGEAMARRWRAAISKAEYKQ